MKTYLAYLDSSAAYSPAKIEAVNFEDAWRKARELYGASVVQIVLAYGW